MPGFGEQKNAARQRAKAGYRSKVAGAEGALDVHEKGAIDRQRALRAGVAKGYADAAGSSYGMASGGGMMGSLGQLGMDAEMQGIRQQTAEDEITRQLTSGISDAQISEAEYDAGAGSEEEDYAKIVSDATKYIEGEIRLSQGVGDDNEERMYAAVRMSAAEARAAGNERAALWIEKNWAPGGKGHDDIDENWFFTKGSQSEKVYDSISWKNVDKYLNPANW